MTRPFEFLTLTRPEAMLIVASLNGHLRTPGISAYDELTLTIADSLGPDAEGERLDTYYGVEDWRELLARILALTEPQSAAVLDAVERFWDADLDRQTPELLSEVGLL